MSEKYEIIDAHTHIFPVKLAEKASASIGKFYDVPMKRVGSADILLSQGKKAGISRFLVCSAATVPGQVRAINDFIADECEHHPEFIGYGTLHPALSPAELAEEVEYIRSRHLLGIKLHPDFQRFRIDDPAVFPMYKAAEGKLPVLFHMGDDRYDFSGPKRLLSTARKFEGLTCVAAHFGGYQQWDEADVLAGLPNVWFDTSSSISLIGRERALRLVELFTPERLFFGSDFPMWTDAEELAQYLSLGLSEEENRMILGGNLKKFLNLP